MIDGVLPHYYISTYSRVYSTHSRKILSSYPTSSTDPHQNIYLYLDNGSRIKVKVYRLTMMAFEWFPGCLEFRVNHKDGNPLNNHISNLEWCTSSYNRIHAIHTGLADYVLGENHNLSTITNQEVYNIIEYYLSHPGCKCKEISDIYGHPWAIHDIVDGNSRLDCINRYLYENYGDNILDEYTVHEICKTIVEIGCIYKNDLLTALHKRNIMIYQYTPEYLAMRLIAHKRYFKYSYIYNKYDF